LFIPVPILSLCQSYCRSRKVPQTQKETHHNNDKYLSSGLDRLARPDCGKAYVDQTGRDFTKGFTEHLLSFINNNTTSIFVQHLQEYGHSFGMMENVMQVVHFSEEVIHMCIIEKFYMDKKKLQKVITCMINRLYNPAEFLSPSSDVKVM